MDFLEYPIFRAKMNCHWGLSGWGDFSWISIFAVETVFTCVLALVTLNVSSGPGPNWYFGIAIGSCLTLGGIASSKISGLLNPAVVWSVAISAATESFGTPSLAFHCLAFCLFEIAGGILASSLHQLVQDIPHIKTRSFWSWYIIIFASENNLRICLHTNHNNSRNATGSKDRKKGFLLRLRSKLKIWHPVRPNESQDQTDLREMCRNRDLKWTIRTLDHYLTVN